MVAKQYETAFTLYPYERAYGQNAGTQRHPVVVVGGGPVGLTLALDLGRKGTPVLVLDDQEGAGFGSRAICFSKRSLDIAHRLSCSAAMLEKGVVWNIGKVFHDKNKIFEFDLQPDAGHRHPAFINLQQPYFEKFVVEGIRQAQAAGAPIEIRGVNQVIKLEHNDGYVTLDVDTPDGVYQLEADWLVACDGARSPVRQMMDLSFEGRVFEDNFLIADIKMNADFPTERWFWFNPPFEGAGQSALLHKQPDDIWRIDFQLGWDIDRKAELDPARIRERVDAMLSTWTGEAPEYELVWTSIYTFQCRRMEKFKHGQVLFAGDAAHQVSPFGARGANSGIQDADNLGWKLDLVVRGIASADLLDTYSSERVYGANENILNSTRATDFLTPKSEISKIFRNAVLDLAENHTFARPLVNSGRLSVPCVYDGSSLNGPDMLANGPVGARPGSPCPDAKLYNGYVLDLLTDDFSLLGLNTPVPQSFVESGVIALGISLMSDSVSAQIAKRYLGDAKTGVYLIRPDQHVVGRWPNFDETAIRAALSAAVGKA